MIRNLTFVLLETGDRAAVTGEKVRSARATTARTPGPQPPAAVRASRPQPRSPSEPGTQTPTSSVSLGHAASWAAVFRLLRADHTDRSLTI